MDPRKSTLLSILGLALGCPLCVTQHLAVVAAASLQSATPREFQADA
jgi:ABC-type molybdate transport system substrate-binding protein